jgi:hypothetical protein
VNKAKPPTAPGTSSKAAAANSRTSRCPGPAVPASCGVADNLDQAIEDITYGRSLERNQRWISRTAQTGIDPALRLLPTDPTAERARLVAELAALDRFGPPSVRADLTAARQDLDRLRRSRQHLDRGTGRWAHTPAGRAARQLDQARQERRTAERRAQLAVGRRERPHWRRLARVAASAEARAQQDRITHTTPVADTLDRRITTAERRVTELEGLAAFHGRWLAEHPDLARHVKHVHRQLQRLDDPINAELLDRLHALGRDDPPVGTRAQEQDDITKVRQRLDRLQRTHTIEPPGLAL